MKVLHVFIVSLKKSFGDIEKVIDSIFQATGLRNVENIVLSSEAPERRTLI